MRPEPDPGTTDDRRAVLAGVVHEIATRTDPARPARVAIDGITAAGKTTFADDLAHLLRRIGGHAVRVTMDGFHQPRAVRYRQGRESPDGYYEDAYDLAGLRRCFLDPLGPGGDRRYRPAVWDLAADRPATGAPVEVPEDTTLVVDGSFLQRPEVRDGWDLVVYLHSPFEAVERRGVARDAAALGGSADARRLFRGRYHAAQRRYLAEVDPERLADVVVDHRDPRRPSLLRPEPPLAPPPSVHDPYLRASRSWFAARAALWDRRHPAGDPALAGAVAQLGLRPGDVVLDVGCGTGRALPGLRRAVGTAGTVAGVDLTPAMAGRASARGPVVVGDARRLPMPGGVADAVLAAHLPDASAGLRELARVTRPGGRLALLRRGAPSHDPDGPDALRGAGWEPVSVHDDHDRNLVVARRAASQSGSAGSAAS